jgi:hypothetical protein
LSACTARPALKAGKGFFHSATIDHDQIGAFEPMKPDDGDEQQRKRVYAFRVFYGDVRHAVFVHFRCKTVAA